jgi:lysophospholipase L1-like esterase
MSHRTTGATAVAIALLVAVLLPACSGDPPDTTPSSGRSVAGSSSPPSPSASSSTAAEAQVYVAVGASETVGVGADDPATEAWPAVLHHRALPEARLVNVGVSGATVEGALRTQLPAALAAEPDVVTVWLAVNDLITAVPVRVYERRLDRLLHALRRDGRTDVLVGNVPDLWRLPAYRACLPGERSDRSDRSDIACVLPFVPSEVEVRAVAARFNQAIRRVVRREGARLVDLSGVPFGGRLTSADGFHPSTAGHRRIAARFAARLP